MAKIYKDGYYVGTVEIKSVSQLRTLEKEYGVVTIKDTTTTTTTKEV